MCTSAFAFVVFPGPHTHIDPPRKLVGNIHVCPLPVPWTILFSPHMCKLQVGGTTGCGVRALHVAMLHLVVLHFAASSMRLSNPL